MDKIHNFSIIIPTFGRPDKAMEAVRSVFSQDYPSDKIEVILINDGSHPRFDKEYNRITHAFRKENLYYVYKRRQQRLIARNVGMRLANCNNWLLHIDDDDELMPNALKNFFSKGISKGDDKYIVAGIAQFYSKDGEKLRQLKPYVPEKDENGNYKHFKSGNITMGQFIFHKSCLKAIGPFPHTHSPGDFAVLAKIPDYGWKEPNDRHDKKWIEVLGNPFGDDYYLYYKLTRHFKVIPIEEVVLKKNCRS